LLPAAGFIAAAAFVAACCFCSVAAVVERIVNTRTNGLRTLT
jgi:hypothetical protein